MANTDTEMKASDPPDVIAVLLVVDERPVMDAIVTAAADHPDIRIGTEPGGTAARDRVTSEPIDCVVADPDALAGDAVQFVDDIRSAAPACPVIWLTRRDPATFDDRVRSAATTIVEQGEDSTEWTFLFEKIRGVVRNTAPQPETDLYKRLVETARDGLYRLDANAEFTYYNESFASMLGYDRGELLGSHASRVMAEGELERGQQLIQRLMQNEDSESELLEMDWTTKAGQDITVAVHFTILTVVDGTYDGVMGVVRDVTERKRREQAIEALHEATREMMRAPDRQQVADCAVETAKAVLGLPVNGLWVHEPEPDRLHPVAWTPEGAAVPGEVPTFAADGTSLAWEVFETGEPRLFEDLRDQPERYNPATPIRSEIIAPVGDHGVVIIGATEPDVFDETDLRLTRLLATNTAAALDRIETTAALQERTEEVARQNRYLSQFYALTTDPETTFDTKLQDVLRLGCEHFGFDVGLLVRPVGETVEVVEAHAPGLPLLAGDTFDPPGDVVADDLIPPPGPPDDGVAYTAAADADEPFPVQAHFGFEAYLQVPVYIGDERYGLLVFGSPTPHADPPDPPAITLAKFVARWLDFELARQRARRDLERQNERLDEFTSVVSHDLRNPLTVASGRLGLAQDECESDHLDAVARALDSMDALIDDTLTLARQGQTVEEPEAVALARVVDAAWATVAPDGTLQVEFDDLTVMADPDRIQQVFENLFRNAAEHAGPEVTVRVGRLPTEAGVFVADDGPGIPADERDTIFDHGYTTSDEGTGFGLSIVRSIVEAHGWTIDVTDSEAGGARFEITGVEPG